MKRKLDTEEEKWEGARDPQARQEFPQIGDRLRVRPAGGLCWIKKEPLLSQGTANTMPSSEAADRDRPRSRLGRKTEWPAERGTGHGGRGAGPPGKHSAFTYLSFAMTESFIPQAGLSPQLWASPCHQSPQRSNPWPL